MVKNVWTVQKRWFAAFFVNQILHAFRLVIVIELYKNETEYYCAKVKFKGFSEDVTELKCERNEKCLKEGSNDIYEDTLS